MAERRHVPRSFESRRRKEQLSFLVVKFLKAYVSFQEIRAEFQEAARTGRLAESGLFSKVRELEETLAFDLKEKAHFLFRAENGRGVAGEIGAEARPAARDTHRLLAALQSSIQARSIDAYIGTGFHLLLILRESLYQLERYAPEFEREKQEIARIQELARNTGSRFKPEELRALERLRALGEISEKQGAESADMAHRVIERCETLFKGTAEVILHLLEDAGENEILVQNLLLNTRVLEKVYGEGAAERIFSNLCRSWDVEGGTGMEKALNYARGTCGNATGLPPFKGRSS